MFTSEKNFNRSRLNGRTILKKDTFIRDVFEYGLTLVGVNILFILTETLNLNRSFNTDGQGNWSIFGFSLQDFFTNNFALYETWVFNMILVFMVVACLFMIIFRAIRRGM